MPNVMAALANIGGAVYKSSLISFLVPRRKVWLTPTTSGERKNGQKVNFAPEKIPLGATARKVHI